MLLYICAKFHDNILDGIKVGQVDKISSRKISKGHNSANILDGVTVFILYTSSDIGLLLYLVS